MNQNTHFEPDVMEAEARQASGGLDDFGDPSYRPALDALAHSLEHEAGLSAQGGPIMRQRLVDQLANRLRIEDYFSRYPEIADEVIAPPVVIVGLMRTGTTKLHRMLSCDPRFYWMAWWETQFPVPLPEETLAQPSARISRAEDMVQMMTEAMPQLTAIHDMEPMAADEEVILMEHAMRSAFDAYAAVPGYARWLRAADAEPPYRYLKRMLQFLQWQKRQRGITADRWILKTPHHLLYMDTLLTVFPNARIVQTHRDPLQCIPSQASFIHTLHGIYSDTPDPASAGRVWSDRMGNALIRTMRVRDRYPANQFLDVDFQDTVERPLAVARRVYDFIGLPMDRALEARIEDWLARDAQSHQGGHHYQATDFGLSDDQIRRDFAEYRARHILTDASSSSTQDPFSNNPNRLPTRP